MVGQSELAAGQAGPATNSAYAGADTCKVCHEDQFNAIKSTRHCDQELFIISLFYPPVRLFSPRIEESAYAF